MRPYEDPIAVDSGEIVVPDFDRETDIDGWVWCTGSDGRGGWTPKDWLSASHGVWRIDRAFNAIELTVAPGDVLQVLHQESSFYWAENSNGERGWIPCDCVSIAPQE